METTTQEARTVTTLSAKIIACPELRHSARDLYRSAVRLERKRRKINKTDDLATRNIAVSAYYASIR